MKDLWQEIFFSLRSNRLRTFLTGFSIAWGIFMLIILLAAGNGLQNGMSSNFRYMSTNSFSIYPGVTNEPYKGLKAGRALVFKLSDVEYLRTHLTHLKDFSPIFNKWSSSITVGDETVKTTLSGVEPCYIHLRNLDMIDGRFFNQIDIRENRKVVVIHKSTADILFKDSNPIGQYLLIDDVSFQVCGVYDEVSAFRNPSFYIPYSTANILFNPSGEISDISFTVQGIDTKEESEAYTEYLRKLTADLLMFDVNDKNALWISDRTSDFLQAKQIFNGISLFVWIIGIGTLIAGVVGVSNIMVITVKERTREFGIRKALGATPGSILKLVIMESITITTIFGYIGMILGVILTEGVASLLANQPTGGDKPVIFLNPTVNLDVVLLATLVLIIAGVIAGYVPARKAVRIKPIEAMQAK